MTELPATTPENQPPPDDNARKFISGPLDPKFLASHSALSYNLVVDWLEADENNERKIARKKFNDGTQQILLIQKITKDGKRTSGKTELAQDEYEELLAQSAAHLEKRRHEFTYLQNGTAFSLKYDEFPQNGFYMLEVEEASDSEGLSFDSATFPATLTEVSGDMRYYGYRIIATLASGDTY